MTVAVDVGQKINHRSVAFRPNPHKTVLSCNQKDETQPSLAQFPTTSDNYKPDKLSLTSECQCGMVLMINLSILNAVENAKIKFHSIFERSEIAKILLHLQKKTLREGHDVKNLA